VIYEIVLLSMIVCDLGDYFSCHYAF